MGAPEGSRVRGEGLNVVELMRRELGIHPENGKRLLAAGYVGLGGRTLCANDRELDPDEASGKTLSVVGRELRIVAPTRYIKPQAALF